MKNSKFEIKTATAVAGVRGTQFIISFDKKTQRTDVITLRGLVSLRSLAAGSVNVDIRKNQKSTVDVGSEKPAEPITLNKEEVKQFNQGSSSRDEKKESAGASPDLNSDKEQKEDPLNPVKKRRESNPNETNLPTERSKTKVKIEIKPPNSGN
jgi:hypothetical protein